MSFECPNWPPQWPEIEAAVLEIFQSGEWGRYHSQVCETLQNRLIGDFQAAFARLCCSGTAALEIGLRVAQIGPGDEVILAAFDFPGNFRTVEIVGATPVLVDLSASPGIRDSSQSQGLTTQNVVPVVDYAQLDTAASDRVRAVIVSHLYGATADGQRLREYCDSRGWILIEDVCQAIGARSGGQPAGSFGQIATLSFGGSKLVSAGSGGALLVNDDRLAARTGALLDRPGDTFPLSPLQAAVILPQLDRLEKLNRMRAKTVEFLSREVVSALNGWEAIGNRAAVGIRQEAALPHPDFTSAHYKYAWMVGSAGERRRVIQAGHELGLPLGEGFRSMSRCSDRRCRKPVPTPWSDQCGQRIVVLDHRALLIESSQYDSLAEALRDVHRRALA